MLYKECRTGATATNKTENKKLSCKLCRRYHSVYIFKTVAESEAIRGDGTRNT